MNDSNDAPTITTSSRGLANPIEYVRRVLENMRRHSLGATVRVSLAEPERPADYVVDELNADTGRFEPVQGYDGSTHRQLSSKKLGDGLNGWSLTRMDRKQVSSLLGELRDFRPIVKSPVIPQKTKKK